MLYIQSSRYSSNRLIQKTLKRNFLTKLDCYTIYSRQDTLSNKLNFENLSDIDTCIRCFEMETIKHLLIECPCTKEIWELLGINLNDIKHEMGTHLTKEELEIHVSNIHFKLCWLLFLFVICYLLWGMLVMGMIQLYSHIVLGCSPPQCRLPLLL